MHHYFIYFCLFFLHLSYFLLLCNPFSRFMAWVGMSPFHAFPVLLIYLFSAAYILFLLSWIHISFCLSVSSSNFFPQKSLRNTIFELLLIWNIFILLSNYANLAEDRNLLSKWFRPRTLRHQLSQSDWWRNTLGLFLHSWCFEMPLFWVNIWVFFIRSAQHSGNTLNLKFFLRVEIEHELFSLIPSLCFFSLRNSYYETHVGASGSLFAVTSFFTFTPHLSVLIRCTGFKVTISLRMYYFITTFPLPFAQLFTEFMAFSGLYKDRSLTLQWNVKSLHWSQAFLMIFPLLICQIPIFLLTTFN